MTEADKEREEAYDLLLEKEGGSGAVRWGAICQYRQTMAKIDAKYAPKDDQAIQGDKQ